MGVHEPNLQYFFESTIIVVFGGKTIGKILEDLVFSSAIMTNFVNSSGNFAITKFKKNPWTQILVHGILTLDLVWKLTFKTPKIYNKPPL